MALAKDSDAGKNLAKKNTRGFAGHWAKPQPSQVANSFGLMKSMARWQRQWLSPQHSLHHTCSIVCTTGRGWGAEAAAAWKRGHLKAALQCLWGSYQRGGARLCTAQSDGKIWSNLKKLKWEFQATYEEELSLHKGSPAVRHSDKRDWAVSLLGGLTGLSYEQPDLSSEMALLVCSVLTPQLPMVVCNYSSNTCNSLLLIILVTKENRSLLPWL